MSIGPPNMHSPVYILGEGNDCWLATINDKPFVTEAAQEVSAGCILLVAGWKVPLPCEAL